MRLSSFRAIALPIVLLLLTCASELLGAREAAAAKPKVPRGASMDEPGRVPYHAWVDHFCFIADPARDLSFPAVPEGKDSRR